MTQPQPNLFDQPAPGLVGHDHPDTSREAAWAVEPRTGTQRRRVLDYIIQCASHGATDWEIQQYLDMDGNTERPRRVELVDGGWVYDSGQRRAINNNNMIVWLATVKALAIRNDR